MAKVITRCTYNYEVSNRIVKENMQLPLVVRVPRQRMLQDYGSERQIHGDITYQSGKDDKITITDANKTILFLIYDENL